MRTGGVLQPDLCCVKFTLLREVRLREAGLAGVPREERFCEVLREADLDEAPCKVRFCVERCCEVGVCFCISIISKPFLPTSFGTIYPVLYH